MTVARNIVILPPAPQQYDPLDQNAVRSLVERALSTNFLVALHADTHHVGGVDPIDHGQLTGLADDDHTQYLRHDGTRALTADWNAGAWDITMEGANVDWVQLNTAFADGSVEGRLQWNSEDGTMEYGLPGGNVTLQVGQEHVIKVRNETGSTITNGSVVYISGASGNRPLITLATAASHPEHLAAGLATEDIAHNSFGYITTEGLVRDVDTLGMTAGAQLFLQPTAGTYGTTQPTPAQGEIVYVGYVIRTHATEGIVLVAIHSIPPLTELSGVENVEPTVAGQFLRWSVTNSQFELNNDASIDHGSISGLGDDDHTQYLRHDGTRALSADWNAGAFNISTASLKLGDGAAATPSLAWTNKTNTGLFYSGAAGGDVAVAVNGTERMRIADGVHIGSSFTTPFTNGLRVEQGILIEVNGIQCPDGSAPAPSFTFFNANDTGFWLASTAPDHIGISIQGFEKGRWDLAGLHVGSTYIAPPSGGIRTEGQIIVEAGGANITGAVTMSSTLGVTGIISASSDIVVTGHIYQNVANDSMAVSGGSAAGSGGNIWLVGESHATQAGDVVLRSDSSYKLQYDASASEWLFMANLKPATDETYSIGTPSFRINTMYTKFLNVESTSTLADITMSGTLTGAAANFSGLGTFSADLRVNNDIYQSVAASFLRISAGDAPDQGGNIIMYADDHATLAYDMVFRSGSTIRMQWDNSDGRWEVQPTAGIGDVVHMYFADRALVGYDGTAQTAILDSGAGKHTTIRALGTDYIRCRYDTTDIELKQSITLFSDTIAVSGITQVNINEMVKIDSTALIGNFRADGRAGFIMAGNSTTTGYGILCDSAVTYLNAPTTLNFRVANGEKATLSATLFYFGVTASFNGHINVNNTIRRAIGTDFVIISGGTSGSLGGNLEMFGESHATLAGDWNLRDDTTDILSYDASAALVSSKIAFEAAANFTHTGTSVGFYGVAATARPAAFTQTYATATRTHSNPTAAALTDSTAGTATQVIAAVSGSGDDTTINDNLASLTDEINKLITDLANAKQVLNQMLDDLQLNGLLQ